MDRTSLIQFMVAHLISNQANYITPHHSSGLFSGSLLKIMNAFVQISSPLHLPPLIWPALSSHIPHCTLQAANEWRLVLSLHGRKCLLKLVFHDPAEVQWAKTVRGNELLSSTNSAESPFPSLLFCYRAKPPLNYNVHMQCISHMIMLWLAVLLHYSSPIRLK